MRRFLKVSFNNKDALRYALFFVMMIALAAAKNNKGIAPFSLGFFAGLYYCGQSVTLLSPLYVTAACMLSPTLETLVISVVPPIVFIATKLLYCASGRQLKLLHVNIYALFAQLPVLIVGMDNAEGLVNAIAQIALSQAFAYCITIALFAALVRGVKYKFQRDELAGLAVLGAGLAMGVFQINIYGFRPFYLIAAFIIMLALQSARPSVAIAVAVTLGWGAGALNGNIMIAGGLVSSACIASVFARGNVYFSAGAYMLADIFMGTFFTAYGVYGVLHIVAVAAGLLIFIAIPKKYRDKLTALYGEADGQAERAIIAKNRKKTQEKILDISGIFADLGDLIYSPRFERVDSQEVAKRLADEIAADCCAVCANRDICSRAMGGNIAEALMPVIESAAEGGSVSADNLTPFLTSRCVRSARLIETVNDKITKAALRTDKANGVLAGRILLGEQMRGLSDVLRGIADSVNARVSFDSEREHRIIAELAYANIVCREVVCEEANGWEVTLTVREEDADKDALVSIVSDILRCPMTRKTDKYCDISGCVAVRLEDDVKYSVVCGVATQIKEGSESSGDTYSYGFAGDDKYIIALADGMGSGKYAHYNACNIISTVENYYRAGFDNNLILSLMNKLLATYNNDNFTCLDMCIVNLNSGVADFIKLGGVNGLIKRGDSVEVIESGALPMGIVEEAVPVTVRRVMYAGDMIVLMSDGVTDALGVDGVKQIMQEQHTGNPQALADYILQTATRGGAADDSTVLAVRILLKENKK